MTVEERVAELLAEAPPLSDAECVEVGQAMAKVLASASRQLPEVHEPVPLSERVSEVARQLTIQSR